MTHLSLTQSFLVLVSKSVVSLQLKMSMQSAARWPGTKHDFLAQLERGTSRCSMGLGQPGPVHRVVPVPLLRHAGRHGLTRQLKIGPVAARLPLRPAKSPPCNPKSQTHFPSPSRPPPSATLPLGFSLPRSRLATHGFECSRLPPPACPRLWCCHLPTTIALKDSALSSSRTRESVAVATSGLLHDPMWTHRRHRP